MRVESIKCMLASICLVSLCFVTLIGARDATEYIDTSWFGGLSPPYIRTVADIVDKHGSEDPEKTVELLHELYDAIDNKSPEGMEKFNLEGQNFHMLKNLVQYLLDLSDQSCDKFITENSLKTTTYIADENLEGFAKDDPIKDSKLETFVRYHTRKTLGVCLSSAVESPLGYCEQETMMDKLISHYRDIVSGTKDKELMIRAEQLNLRKGKFDGRAMLNAIDNYSDRFVESGLKAHKRLDRHLKTICRELYAKFSLRFDIYNLARLLSPSEVEKVSPSDRFLKLNEYLRVCMPTMHPIFFGAIYKNIKKNMGFSISCPLCFRH